MKALILNKAGKDKEFKIVHDREIPKPKANEIRVKVHAVGLNHSDYQIAYYLGESGEKKLVLGLDVAGVVDEVGSEVTNLKKGDRVYYVGCMGRENGGYAEYACTTANTVSKLPDEISFEVAAAIPATGFAAYQSIFDKLKPTSGNTILVHGGAGGVGGYALQLSKICGLKVYTTCLEKDNEYVRSLGADETIDFSKEDVYGRISELTEGIGVDYVLNTVNSETATKDIEALAFSGEIAVIAGYPDFGKVKFFEKGISIHEIAVGAAHLSNDERAHRKLAEIGDEFARLLVNKKIVPPILTIISMEDIPACLRKLEERRVTGKIVAKII